MQRPLTAYQRRARERTCTGSCWQRCKLTYTQAVKVLLQNHAALPGQQCRSKCLRILCHHSQTSYLQLDRLMRIGGTFLGFFFAVPLVGVPPAGLPFLRCSTTMRTTSPSFNAPACNQHAMLWKVKCLDACSECMHCMCALHALHVC